MKYVQWPSEWTRGAHGYWYGVYSCVLNSRLCLPLFVLSPVCGVCLTPHACMLQASSNQARSEARRVLDAGSSPIPA